ncbi:Sarcalumenin [Orchesella cincta]|uniref:Sarcalumenin n=1 Tax=Orchesella cincta TaxID=48709 RepID=A0A1D2NAU6_ORCCI|nr:Sarcalumenin [Orchesella cincta]
MSDSNLRHRGSSQHVRAPTNTIDQHVLSLNEKILNEVFNIYMEKDVGLCELAKMVDVDVRVPRKKITVLLLGNHSAGKSSFINWYIEETILKTGVAIETQGYFFVVSGKKRDTLKGKATLELYPHLRPLQNFPGCIDYLTTEISTSRARKFNLVTFIDTPGLVDGDMHYPYDVNETLLWLGDIADLVFVFFDPMGQALCKRTLNVVEKMWANQSDKMRLFLAKADEAGSETDRQRVLMQIVQELCKRPGLNRTGFDMPTIYLPDGTSKATKCANQIEEVCAIVEKTIEQTIQNSLNNLDKDALLFKQKLEARLNADNEARSRNFSRRVQSWCYSGLGIILPILLLLSLIVANATREAMRIHIGPGADIIYTIMKPLAGLWLMIPEGYHLQIVTAIVVVSGCLLIISRLFCAHEYVLPKRELKIMKRGLEFVDNAAERKKVMYADYLRQSLTDADFCE